MPPFNPTYGTVLTEGCPLHYWHQGSGPLITFVPGGNGHGRQYNGLIAALSDRYTCLTFDRRQMSASQLPPPAKNKRLNPVQQARDVRAVIHAVGFSSSIIFGSSLGGIIVLQLAKDYPEIVEHLISHEAPTFVLLPNASEVFEWLLHLLDLRDEQGIPAAEAEFATMFVGVDDEKVPKTTPPERSNPLNFWENEFYTASTYTPDLRSLVERETSVGIMRGVRSGDALYARTTYEQAQVLGCPIVEVPGHHQGFEVEVEAFVPALLDLIALLEERKAKRKTGQEM